jgi:plastocyanin
MLRTTRNTAIACLAAATIGLPAAATARTKTVYADAPPSAQKTLMRYAGAVNDFFLHTVTINRGDTVSFLNEGFHTIDLPGRSGKDLPLFVQGSTVSGVNDAAGNPFWFDGHKPSIFLDPQFVAPSGPSTYDGTTRVESGLPAGSGPPKPFKVKFTKPGAFKYFCDIHPGMIGYVVVRATGKPVPSAAQDAAALSKQLRTDLASANQLSKTKVNGNNVYVGVSDFRGVEDYAMFPSKLTVHAGAVVTFSMSRDSREIHTATFGPSNYLMAMANSLATATPQQQGWYPSDNPSLGAIRLGPTTHGNGFANTGGLDSVPATSLPASGKIKFTKAGTYRFICLIHPFMKGTIVVQ